MKTKNIVVAAALFAAVCAVVWTVACSTAEQSETPPHPSVVIQPVAPVVVTPVDTFDLEVSSPTDVNHDEPVDPAAGIEMPTPDLTWYDPNGLQEVGNIS